MNHDQPTRSAKNNIENISVCLSTYEKQKSAQEKRQNSG